MATKKVKMLQSVAGQDFSYIPGEEAEIDGKVADSWADHGICEILEEKKASEDKKKGSEDKKNAAKGKKK